MMNKEDLTKNLVEYIAYTMRPYKNIKRAGGLLSIRDLNRTEERCYGAIDFFFDTLDAYVGLTNEDEEEIDNYWTFIQSEFKALRGE